MQGGKSRVDEIFPQRLRELRKRRRLSGQVLGELCGLSKNVVYSYEKAEASPTIGSLCAIADFFDVSTDFLLGRDSK